MKLFLSSYRAGGFSQELVNFFGAGAKVALIANAADSKTKLKRFIRVFKEKLFLKKLSFKVAEIDLRDFFNKKQDLENELSKYNAVWVRGGNTFILRRAFQLSGFDSIIKKFLSENKITYGGSSAGAVIMSPSLKGLEVVDDPSIVPKGYPKEINWDGLGLINKNLLVHYGSPVAGLEGIKDTEKYYMENKIQYEPMTDNDVFIINDGIEKLLKANKPIS